MASLYHFWHSLDSLQVTLDGATLISGEGDDAVVQRFPSEADARRHLEHIVQHRRRSGYQLEIREVAPLPGQWELAEVAEVVVWEPTARRMTVTFRTAAEARQRTPGIAACAAAKRPICLRLECDPGSPGAVFAAALLAAPLPSVTRLVFDTHHQTLARQRSNAIGDLADLLAAMPALESAFLSGELLLRPCEHASLRALWLLGDPLLHSSVSALGRCRLPALERLGLTLRHEADEGPEAHAARALRSLDAPALRTVDIAGVGDIPDFLARLAPLPPHWSQLRVTGSVGDEDALLAVLERHAAEFTRLERLALPLCDELSSDGDEQARRLVPSLVDVEELADPFLPTTYESW